MAFAADGTKGRSLVYRRELGGTPVQLAGLAEHQCDAKDDIIRKPIGLVTCPNCQVVMPPILLRFWKTKETQPLRRL
jgi:hypothetical protein